MSAVLTQICRYPVKGLSAQFLPRIRLVPDRGVPDDRRFALMPGGSALGGEPPGWRPKSHFLTLARHERLAALQTDYDEATATLVIRRNGRPVVRGALTTSTGRAVIEQFLAAYMAGEVPGMPKVVEMPAEPPGALFTDRQEPLVSLLNLASIQDIERIVHQPVHPLRFRANLHLEGLAPWEEHGLVGRTLAIGTVRLEIVGRIQRCAATSVDPLTGARDLNIPRALQKGFGHCDCGVYGRVVAGGDIAVGNPVAPI